MRNMQVIAEDQLQGVRACLQRYFGGREAIAKMHVMGIGGNGRPQC